jgi:hypothetical protein
VFRDKAVLILGAGASAPYNFPIGDKLIASIADGLVKLPKDFDRGIISNNESNILRSPCTVAYRIAQSARPPWIDPHFIAARSPAWRDLGDQLRHDSSGSIDEFARINPTKAGAIKLLIAAEILSHTYDHASLENGQLVPDHQIGRNARQKWYGKLLARLRRHFRDAKAFDPEHPLTVVTFNYDRSLELFLDQAMSSAELYRGMNWADAISIIHLHGEVTCERKMDGLPLEVHVTQGILASAEKMLVVDDPRGPQDPAKVATKRLEEADHIVSLGFDFHEQNVELLRLTEFSSKIRALNFTGSKGFDRKASRVGIDSENIWKRNGQEYPITDAIDEGIFEA